MPIRRKKIVEPRLGDVIIIAGSRSFEPDKKILSVIEYNKAVRRLDDLVNRIMLESTLCISKIITGGAIGIDRAGIRYAERNNIPYDTYFPIWRVNGIYNPRAGFDRNSLMADNGDKAVIIWDGVSSGSKHMICEMQNRGKEALIYVENPKSIWKII